MDRHRRRCGAASFKRATDPALADGDGFSLPAAIYLIDIEGVEERLAGTTDKISGITLRRLTGVTS